MKLTWKQVREDGIVTVEEHGWYLNTVTRSRAKDFGGVWVLFNEDNERIGDFEGRPLELVAKLSRV